MPWKESDRLMERASFIMRLESGERMTDLCKEFGISRKTGYKYLERYKRYGSTGLLDQNRRPELIARKTPKPVEQLILDLRHERPTWGAAKIGEILRQRHPEVRIPVRSTIHDILDRNGLIKRKRRKRYKANPTDLRSTSEPNDLWCADFKGHFRLGNKNYCYPLTITDHLSRYLIACESVANTGTENAILVFTEAFEEYGLPFAIRTDNGAPFSTRGLLGLSKLAVWWIKLGIAVERIEPGKPQQNGRHERMHLTLKQETTRPPGDNEMQRQERFELFKHDFNEVRPHEALDMMTPGSKYKRSNRIYPQHVPDPDYPTCDHSCYVNRSGKVYVPGNGNFNLTNILAEEQVGLTQEDDKQWSVQFADLVLGYFDAIEGVFHSKDGHVK